MEEFYQTQADLDELFGDLLVNLTKLPKDKVLATYSPMGKPGFKHSEDVLFFTVSTVDSPVSQFKNRTDSTSNIVVNRSSQYTREIMLMLTVYGPNSSDINTRLLHRFSERTTKEYLKKNKLAFITDKSSGPFRLPESFNGQWYERCDLTLYFYSAVLINEQFNSFNQAIIVYKEGK